MRKLLMVYTLLAVTALGPAVNTEQGTNARRWSQTEVTQNATATETNVTETNVITETTNPNK